MHKIFSLSYTQTHFSTLGETKKNSTEKCFHSRRRETLLSHLQTRVMAMFVCLLGWESRDESYEIMIISTENFIHWKRFLSLWNKTNANERACEHKFLRKCFERKADRKLHKNKLVVWLNCFVGSDDQKETILLSSFFFFQAFHVEMLSRILHSVRYLIYVSWMETRKKKL